MKTTDDDLVERTRISAELEKNALLLMSLLDAIPIPVFYKDTQGHYLGCNGAFEQFVGLSARDLKGKTVSDLLPPELAREMQQHDQALLQSRERQIIESHLPYPDGTMHDVVFHKATFHNGDGIPSGLIGAMLDITEQKQIHHALRASEQHARKLASLLRLMCDNVPDMIWAKDLQQRYLFANKALSAQFLNARDTDEPLGKTDAFFALREQASHENNPQWHTFGDLAQDGEAQTMSRGRGVVFESAGHIKGRYCILEVHKAPLCADNGEIIGSVGLARDITERKRAEDQLHLAASVFTHASQGIVIVSSDGAILDVNDTFTRITGYERAEVVGLNPESPEPQFHNVDFFLGMWRELAKNGHWSGEFWNRRKNGEVYAELLTASVVCDAQGKPRQYVLLFSDITSLKEHERQLEHLANYDALTTLPNRVLLADRLRQAMVQAERRKDKLAVAYLDLDGFKTINDSYGHEAGDLLLKAVAIRMQQVLRKGDTLARLGGDEFVAVLLDLASDAASVPILTHLLEAAAKPVRVGDADLQISVSIGVTFYPQPHIVDVDQLLRQSDQAMYQAKLVGKNSYHFFDAARDRMVRGQDETLKRLRRALNQREFVLYYEPVVDMRAGVVVGAEALVRWRHTEQGLLLPAVFLPVIENHPLSVDLGEWVIESALTQMEQWQAIGLDIEVSVNVSAWHLQREDFLERLKAMLQAHPTVKRDHLILEVLETSALGDMAQLTQVFEVCQALGVKFSLDDLGTGYCSLTYLKRLPVSEIKIGQSFVRDMLEDPEDLAIVEGVLSFASAFRHKVIAKGVESAAHGSLLLRLGCDLGQGYGIARPMPAQALPGWIAAWRADPSWGNLAPLRDEDQSMLFAEVELRAWMVTLENLLMGNSELMPETTPSQSHFGQWLDTVGQARYGMLPAFRSVDTLHRRLHCRANALLALYAQGKCFEARAGLSELREIRDALLEQLVALARV